MTLKQQSVTSNTTEWIFIENKINKMTYYRCTFRRICLVFYLLKYTKKDDIIKLISCASCCKNRASAAVRLRKRQRFGE